MILARYIFTNLYGEFILPNTECSQQILVNTMVKKEVKATILIALFANYPTPKTSKEEYDEQTR